MQYGSSMVSVLSAVAPIILIIIPLGISPEFYVTRESNPQVDLTVANVTADPEIR